MQQHWSILIALVAVAGALAGCTDTHDHSDGHHDEMHDDSSMDNGHAMAGDSSTGGMHGMHSGTHNTTGMAVVIDAHNDSMSGYNLHVMTEGFTFTPAAASTEHVDGEGHAHIYVDGTKIGRLYSNWYHMSIEPGEHVVKVSLNGNDHVAYAVDGIEVAASQTVVVPAA